MDNNCCSCSVLGNRMVLSCSGASNFGQISNALAVDMQERGMGSMSCLAAMGAGLSGYIKSAQEADQLVVIDGCQVGCGQIIMKSMGLDNYVYFIVSKNLPEVKKGKRYEDVAQHSNSLWDRLIDSL